MEEELNCMAGREHSGDLSIRTRDGEFVWRVSLSALKDVGFTDVDSLTETLTSFPTVDRLPGAQVLKGNRLRRVCRVTVSSAEGDSNSGFTILTKEYRYVSLRDRVRYLLWRSRAEQEWFALGRFRQLGLPAPRALAIAAHQQGRHIAGGLVMEFLNDTRPFVELVHAGDSPLPDGAQIGAAFRAPDPTAQHLRWLQTGAQWVRTMHDRGVWHRDLHGGNVLVHEKEGLYFIDLHSCRFLPRLARWQRWDGVSMLLHSLAESISSAGMEAFLEAYGVEVLGGGASLKQVSQELRRRIAQRQRKRLASRSKRCFKRSTMFEVTTTANVRTYHRRELDLSLLDEVWQAPSSAELLKKSDRGWVGRRRLGDRSVCVKFHRPSLLEALQSLFESHRLRRAYAAGHALWVRRIPTAPVLALREERRFGLPRGTFLVTEYLENAVSLDQFAARAFARPARAREGRPVVVRRGLVAAVARLVRRVHDYGLYPHDLSPQNILVVEGTRSSAESSQISLPEVYLVDLDHLYLWQRLTERGRVKNLAQVANMPEGHVTTADLVRGLRVYASGAPSLGGREMLEAIREQLLDLHLRLLLRLNT